MISSIFSFFQQTSPCGEGPGNPAQSCKDRLEDLSFADMMTLSADDDLRLFVAGACERFQQGALSPEGVSGVVRFLQGQTRYLPVCDLPDARTISERSKGVLYDVLRINRYGVEEAPEKSFAKLLALFQHLELYRVDQPMLSRGLQTEIDKVFDRICSARGEGEAAGWQPYLLAEVLRADVDVMDDQQLTLCREKAQDLLRWLPQDCVLCHGEIGKVLDRVSARQGRERLVPDAIAELMGFAVDESQDSVPTSCSAEAGRARSGGGPAVAAGVHYAIWLG